MWPLWVFIAAFIIGVCIGGFSIQLKRKGPPFPCRPAPNPPMPPKKPRYIAGLLLLLCASAQASTVAATKVSPDGQWKVELADFRQHQVFELFSTPAVGGVRRQIGKTVPPLSDIRTDFQFSPDSRKIIYEQGETASGSNHRLWLTSIDRADGRVVSQQPAQSGVGFDYPIRLVCYDSYVEFRSDPVVDEQYQTYQVNFNGVIQPCVIFNDGFETGNSGRWQ